MIDFDDDVEVDADAERQLLARIRSNMKTIGTQTIEQPTIVPGPTPGVPPEPLMSKKTGSQRVFEELFSYPLIHVMVGDLYCVVGIERSYHPAQGPTTRSMITRPYNTQHDRVAEPATICRLPSNVVA
ncbi:hypothetical protein OIO90_004834 [Microbotryomycetes sp. JL221]|nr:hypothetical protein OIO90_004834 [Microbotryomycetes sp. JL221]